MRIFGVDAFTDKPFKGNPAAVCILQEPRDEGWMQNVAAEMNLSETAFVLAKGEGYDLRWFTPKVEVDLCGHATLAAAHILFEIGKVERAGGIQFNTKSGVLGAYGKDSWIELDFPAEPEEESIPPESLLKSLHTDALYTGKNRFDYLVEVDSEERVREMVPDLSILAEVPCRGIIVTSRSSCRDYDFISRFFAPRVGVNEDPVTGSAHCCLGPYWKKKLKKSDLRAYQASKRGGFLKLRLEDERVHIAGRAVLVWKGEIADID